MGPTRSRWYTLNISATESCPEAVVVDDAAAP